MGNRSRTLITNKVVPITSGFIILFKQKAEKEKELMRRNCFSA